MRSRGGDAELADPRMARVGPVCTQSSSAIPCVMKPTRSDNMVCLCHYWNTREAQLLHRVVTPEGVT